MGNDTNDTPGDEDEDACVTPDGFALPPEEMGRYSAERDWDREQDIANYVESQARDETLQHVEKIKSEYILGTEYECWDVITDKDRYWVIDGPTNLYSQKHFPSLDYTISFHVGLMMRIRSRYRRVDADDPHPFDEVFRRQEQAEDRLETAVEAEDFQAVGMLLRESLISLSDAARRRVTVRASGTLPQGSNFVGWVAVLARELCAGRSKKVLRHYVTRTAKETWDTVNWLTHHRNADKTSSVIAFHACQTLVGHFAQLLMRRETEAHPECPHCASRHIRTHFDITIGEDGDYYSTCGQCGWSNHPEVAEESGIVKDAETFDR